MQLLTVGKSISSIEDAPTRYRMSVPYSLPQFGSAKNKPITPQKGSASNSQATHNKEYISKRGPISIPTKPESNTMNPEAVFRPQAHAQKPKPGVTEKSGWIKGISRLLRIMRRPWKGLGREEDGPAAIQGEFRLDSVHPVCNDLVESDLEVVRRTSAPARNPFLGRAHARTQGQSFPGKLLSRLAARFLGT